jgi:hypothetical protein
MANSEKRMANSEKRMANSEQRKTGFETIPYLYNEDQEGKNDK